jgi:glycosyltransferase involved in cell wall biosynthesis
MTRPDVSIVVPTRERHALLEVTLHSILASAAEARREGVETEIIVVDDASPTDATRALCKRMGVRYDRLTVHDGRDNPASAIARGISLVKGRHYSLFGDDDIMLPRFIRLHHAALESGFDVCTGSYLIVDATLATTQTVVLPPPRLGDLLAGRITINDGAMVRTELVQDMEWDPALEQAILYPIWLELLDQGRSFQRLEEPTWLYRRHDANVSARRPPHDRQLRELVQERFRERILARDGVLPEATPVAPAVQPPAPPSPRSRGRVRRLASRMRRAFPSTTRRQPPPG